MADEQIVEDKVSDDPVVSDDQVTEDDLRDLKYGSDEVETSNEEDESDESDETEDTEEEGEEDGQTDDQATFTKEFPNIKGDTPEEYAKNLEIAYQNSTAEALRLKGLTDKPADNAEKPVVDTSDPVALFMKQKMDEEITTAYTKFADQYPQVKSEPEYAKFTSTVAELSQTILQSQGRLAPPAELYKKAAAILDWQSEVPTPDDKLKDAVRNNTSTSRTSSTTKKTSTSKVTDAMVATNRKMYPNKTDAQIREELEPYVN